MLIMGIGFTKMHGLGNDFVILDGLETALGGADLAADPSLMRRIADRRRGVGCDQVILLDRPDPGSSAHRRMRIFNPDGSEAGACGNATRCVASQLTGLERTDRILIDTKAGQLVCAVALDGIVSVDMGLPRLEWQTIPLAKAMDTAAIVLDPPTEGAAALGPGCAVSMGNPHCVFFLQDLDGVNIERIGPDIEHHALFPERTNVGFARIIDRSHIRLRVWERGAGLTQACGSGACAAAVAAARRGLTERSVRVTVDGGDLHIFWDEEDHVQMSGPAATSFAGTLDPSLLNAPVLSKARSMEV